MKMACFKKRIYRASSKGIFIKKGFFDSLNRTGHAGVTPVLMGDVAFFLVTAPQRSVGPKPQR
jgi:hypothetical protein